MPLEVTINSSSFSPPPHPQGSQFCLIKISQINNTHGKFHIRCYNIYHCKLMVSLRARKVRDFFRLSMALQPIVRPWSLFPLSWSYIRSVRLLGRGISPTQSHYLHTGKQNKGKQTSLPWVGFDPTTSAFELENTVNALDRSVTAIGIN